MPMIVCRLVRPLAIFTLEAIVFACTSPLRCAAQELQPGTAGNAAEYDGGAISHFVYLHAPEIFPVAVLKRSGTIRALPERLDVLQPSESLAGDVKESRNGNPTRDLQMAADRSRPHTLCGPVVPSLFSFAARC
jgi:hypothetical protein